MELLKNTLLAMTICLSSIQTYAQDANYTKQSKAFGISYEKETAKEYGAAIYALKEVYDKESYEINLRLGWLYYLSGNQQESIIHYNIAITLKPFAIEPKFGLTYPLFALKNTEKLIEAYNDILTIAPRKHYCLIQTGKCIFLPRTI